MDSLYQLVSELKRIVKNSPDGCLPCVLRQELVNSLKDRQLLEKVYFECAKKIYLCWKQEFGVSFVPYQLLRELDVWLYQRKGELSVIRELADRSRRYFNNQPERYRLMGYILLMVCYYVSDGEEWLKNEYKDIGDLIKRKEDLSPDYLSSLIWAGGSILGEGQNTERCREFWNWYLYMIFRISERPGVALLELEETVYASNRSSRPSRSQLVFTPEIQERLQNVAELVVDECQKVTWDTAEIVVYRFDYSALYFTLQYQSRRLVYRLPNRLMNQIYEYMEEIHRQMYFQARHEGAWMQCALSVLPDGMLRPGFNYDDYTSIPRALFEPADFVTAFECYPRSREYTPLWWQELLGKNARYIE